MGELVPRGPGAWRQALDRVRFALERLVLRGLGYRLLLAAAIVATVALTAGGLVAIFDADSSDLGEIGRAHV